MRKEILVTGTILALSFSIPAWAQGRGVGNAGAGLGAGAGAGGGGLGAGAGAGGSASVNGNFGGQSDANINAQGRANTNGPNATDRGLGVDRATVRASGNADKIRADAANELGKLNAGHASATARGNASANSAVGDIATYETKMKAALAIRDSSQRTAAITAARQELAASTNKELTPTAVARVDGMLGIQGASPRLGTAP